MTTQVSTNGNGHTHAPASFTEAPASATLRVVSATGFEVLLTTRAGRMSDLLSQLTTLEAWLSDHQWTPAPTGRPTGKATAQAQASDGPAPTCDKCGQPMIRRTTRDGSRSFWSCQTRYGSEWCKGKPKEGQS